MRLWLWTLRGAAAHTYAGTQNKTHSEMSRWRGKALCPWAKLPNIISFPFMCFCMLLQSKLRGHNCT